MFYSVASLETKHSATSYPLEQLTVLILRLRIIIKYCNAELAPKLMATEQVVNKISSASFDRFKGKHFE